MECRNIMFVQFTGEGGDGVGWGERVYSCVYSELTSEGMWREKSSRIIPYYILLVLTG